MVSNQRLKWKTDFDKPVLIQNFEKRGWQKATGDGKLKVFWRFDLICTDWFRRLEYILG